MTVLYMIFLNLSTARLVQAVLNEKCIAVLLNTFRLDFLSELFINHVVDGLLEGVKMAPRNIYLYLLS